MKLRKITKWYHATTLEAAQSILECGYIMPNSAGIVFLAAKKEDANFFLKARGNEEFVVFEIPRRELDNKVLFSNPATAMLTCVYCAPIAVTNKHCKHVVDHEEPFYGIDGIKVGTQGHGKTFIDIDAIEFDDYLINKVGKNVYKQFQQLITSGKQHEAEKLLETNWQ